MTLLVPVLYSFILGALTTQIFSTPTASDSLVPRDRPSPDVAGFTLKILDGNGIDISSGFQTMIFNGTPSERTSNFTDRQEPWTREIGSCQHQGAIFLRSFCKRPRATVGDLQDHFIACAIPPSPPPHIQPSRNVLERGRCFPNEICVDAPLMQNRSPWEPHFTPRKAYCVGKRGFHPTSEFLDVQKKHGFILWKSDTTGDFRFTAFDKQTLLKAQSIDIEVLDNDGAALQSLQNSSCTECDSLGVTANEEGGNLLKIQATILGATTGILWIASMPGVMG